MILYLLAALLFGYSSIIFQIIYLREFLTIFYGNELCIGTILALWLFGIASGALLGSVIADRIKTRVMGVFLGFLLLLHILFPIFLYLLRISIPLFLSTRGEYIPFYNLLIAVLCLIVPVSAIVGILFPLSCSGIQSDSHAGISAGLIYLFEAVGSLAGGCLFTFVYVMIFDNFQLAVIQLFLALALTGSYLLRQRHTYLALYFIMLCAAGGFIFGTSMPGNLNNATVHRRWDAFFSPLPLDRSVNTRYQNVALSRQGDQLDIYTNLKYTESVPDPYSNELYAQFALCQSPHPSDILIIQGVFSGLVDACRSHSPKSVDILELDRIYFDTVTDTIPDIVEQMLDYPQVTLRFVDGRFFVKRTDNKYDLIFIAVSDPDTAMLNRFYTLDFFENLKSVLSPQGVVAFKLTSAPNYMGQTVGRYNSSLYKTLTAAFDHVLVTHGETKFFVAASAPDVISADPQVLISRYEQRGITREIFFPQAFYSLLDPQRLAFVAANLNQRAEETALNTDAAPVAYHYNLYLWDTFSGSKLTGLLRLFESITPFKAAIALFVVTIILIISPLTARTATRKKTCFRAVLFWVICSTGFSAMGIELLLLFAFQNIFGYLYSMIGFIVALFMFGLTMGSVIGMRVIRRRQYLDRIFIVLLCIEIVIPIFAFMLPSVLSAVGSSSSQLQIQCIFFGLVILSGLLTGMEFPLAVHLFNFDEHYGGYSAGMLDAADHIGACIGSMIIGTFLIPLLGIYTTAILIGMCNISSCIVVAASIFTIPEIQNFPNPN